MKQAESLKKGRIEIQPDPIHNSFERTIDGNRDGEVAKNVGKFKKN